MIDIETPDGRLDPNKLAQLVFARFDPWAAGISVGVVWGFFLAVLTVVSMMQGEVKVIEFLGLLSHYLPGFDVSPSGAVVAFVGAGIAGFGFGASAALLNNLCLKLCHALIRSSAELMGMKDWDEG